MSNWNSRYFGALSQHDARLEPRADCGECEYWNGETCDQTGGACDYEAEDFSTRCPHHPDAVATDDDDWERDFERDHYSY